MTRMEQELERAVLGFAEAVAEGDLLKAGRWIAIAATLVEVDPELVRGDA